METTAIIIQGTPEEIAAGLQRFIEKQPKPKPAPDFIEERLTRAQALKLTGHSNPTFNKRLAKEIFKIHGSGRKQFFLKSELIEALKNGK